MSIYIAQSADPKAAQVQTPQKSVARKRAHRWKVLAVAAAVSGLLFVLALETFVRLFGLDVPRVWEPHRELGWHHIPGATRRFTEEGDGWIAINSLGFRDRERSLAKEAGTFRIMFLGDSMTEAVQVNPNETFCHLLEQRFNEKGKKVEVLNFGVNGYSPLQELLLLRREAARYHPDLVVLGLFLDNDVAGCHPTLNTKADEAPSAKLDGQTLVFDFSRPEESYASYHRQPVYSIRKLSAVYRWLRAGRAARAEQAAPAAVAANNVIPTRHMLYADRSPPQWDQAWAVLERSLQDLSAESARQGARFLIVSLPSSQVVDADVWATVLDRQPAMRGKTWDLEAPERRLSAFAQQHQLPLFQLLPKFQARAKGGTLFIGNVGHLNPRGHQVVAELVEKYLNENHLLNNVASSTATQL